MKLADSHAEFRDALLAAELLVATSSPGLYGRSGTFESIVDGVDRLVTQTGADQQAQVLRFPAVLPRVVFERTDYIVSFPDLTGAVYTFVGDERAHAALLAKRAAGEDWSAALNPSDLMLVSAACHSVYPMLSGSLPAGGRRLDVLGLCFRHEPAVDPARMQAFRMHEYVYVGEPSNALAHREEWIKRGLQILQGLELDAIQVVANDPFFGRGGRMLAASQLSDNLKVELVVRLYGDGPDSGDGTALASSNYHVDHFGTRFGICTANGEVAHSACGAFGLDRIALALLRTHGLTVESWPAGIRSRLFP